MKYTSGNIESDTCPIGTNQISDESCFIRLKDHPTYFLHFQGNNPDNPTEEVVYDIQDGYIGASIWHKQHGEIFIKDTGANNLELVKVFDICGEAESNNII